MSRRQKQDEGMAVLAEGLKTEPGAWVEDGGEDASIPAGSGETEHEAPIDGDGLADNTAAPRPEGAVKKARLVLVKAASYADAIGGGMRKIKKGVPFEADEAAVKKLLETGLFKEA
jgi:hypothetical protein